VSVSFCLGGLGATCVSATSGGCGAMEADSMGAPEYEADQALDGCETLGTSCQRQYCCTELVACSADNRCVACQEQEASACDNQAWNALSFCSLVCNQGPHTDAASPPPPTLTLAWVHASAELFPVRVCLKNTKTNEFITPSPLPDKTVMPHSNVVGLAPGSAFVMTGFESHTAESELTAVAYLLSVHKLKDLPEKPCNQLVCTGGSCLTTADYITSETLTLRAPAAQNVELLVIQGCRAAAGSKERCGPSYEVATGNAGVLQLPQLSLSFSPPQEGQPRLYGAQLSPSVRALWLPEAGTAELQYGTLGASDGTEVIGGAIFEQSWSAPGGTLQVTFPGQLITLPDKNDAEAPEYGNLGFTLLASSSDGGLAPRLQMSLAAVQDLSESASLPAAFWHGSTDFLIAVVGDVTAESQWLLGDGGLNPAFTGEGLHILAVPLRPTDADAGAR
jgi:hypothetical protein